MSTLAYSAPSKRSTDPAVVALYVLILDSASICRNPCLATVNIVTRRQHTNCLYVNKKKLGDENIYSPLTYLCRSILRMLPRFLSTTSPRTMYSWSYSYRSTSVGYPYTFTSFSHVSVYASTSNVSGLYMANV